MKGVILGIAPAAQIVDLSHVVAAQNIREAALILGRSAPYFPPGTVHVVVVDPGVGTARRPLAARIGTQLYVGPDNGTITLLLERAEQEGWTTEFFHLDKPAYWLADVSHVFHGRDIFAPCAAHLASGKTLNEIGTPVSDPARIAFPRPQRTAAGLRGELVHIDHFGNAASNIRIEHVLELLAGEENPAAAMDEKSLRGAINRIVASGARFSVSVAGVEIHGLISTFGERAPGQAVALFGSTGSLFASVVNGSFAAEYAARVGQEFILRMQD
jgi:S-adenosylmethionine hydrolase